MLEQLSQSRPYLSIIMPAYNDAEALQAFLPEVFAFTQTLRAPVDIASAKQNLESSTARIANCEIIIVDDGSRDNLVEVVTQLMPTRPANTEDRKSTRLNSSHVKISYAVFCLKKKK